MDEVVIRDWCRWLNQGFLRACKLRLIDKRVDSGGHFYGSGSHGYSSGEWASSNNV